MISAFLLIVPPIIRGAHIVLRMVRSGADLWFASQDSPQVTNPAVDWHYFLPGVTPGYLPSFRASSSLAGINLHCSEARVCMKDLPKVAASQWNDRGWNVRAPTVLLLVASRSPSVSDFPAHHPATSSHSLNSPLSPSITPSLFHSRLKTYLFHKSFPTQTPFQPQDWLHGFMTGPFLLSISVFIFSFFIILFCLVPCSRFSWLYVSFWAHVNLDRWSNDVSHAHLYNFLNTQFTYQTTPHGTYTVITKTFIR